MKRIVVASQNPVKIQAIRLGFQRLFPVEQFETVSVSVPSGVSSQPMSDIETLQGARNRVNLAMQSQPQADFWAGIEGGVEEHEGDLCAFAWVYIRSMFQVGRGRTGAFTLPPAVTQLIQQGKELGEADDIVFQRTNSKQENGAIGLLTGNVIDRIQLYEHAVVLALVPFFNPGLYPGKPFPHN